MPDRPTLYLTNWSSRTMHGPGRQIAAMAVPPKWADVAVPELAADAEDLWKIQGAHERFTLGKITAEQWNVCLRWYRARCESKWTAAGLKSISTADLGLTDGDTLCCTCARPDSPKREHPCHLELLAPFLVMAGWDVVLHGRRLTSALLTVGPDAGTVGPVYTDGDNAGEPMHPEDYGWPAVPR